MSQIALRELKLLNGELTAEQSWYLYQLLGSFLKWFKYKMLKGSIKMLKKIISVVISAVLVLSLCACSSSASTPQEAVEGFAKLYQEQKYTKAFEYVSNYDGLSFDGEQEQTQKMVDAAAKSIKIEVTGSTGTESPYGVVAQVTTVDMREIYELAMAKVTEDIIGGTLSGETISEQDMEKKLAETCVEFASASDAPTVTTEAVFNLEKTDNKWYIVMDDMTVNIITGFMSEADENFRKALYGHDALGEDEDAANSTDDESYTEA